MFLDVGEAAIHLRDVQNQDELEKYTFENIYRCNSITDKEFPSLLQLVCQGAEQKKPDIHFFNCETVTADQICDDITRSVLVSSKSKSLPNNYRMMQREDEMLDPYGIPNPPGPQAPNPPPPYPGLRANSVNGGADVSLLRAEREVGILNHCFDDIESFMGKLQQTAEATTLLNQRKKKKKKSKKQSAEDDLLMARAQPPPEEEFINIFQKFKYCFSLLARLKSAIANPSSEELVHHVFKPLDIMVKTTGGPGMGASVSSPAMTTSAISLLQDTMNEEERELWTSLGPNWTHTLSQLRGPVAPYTPVFFNGWKPEALRADGQVWEDPIESQHKYEALLEKQEKQPPQQIGPPNINITDEMDGMGLIPSDRLYSCSYDFIARNNTELSVQQGETLEVIESSKRWWKCRNRFSQVGFVPFNILEPVAHIDSPVNNTAPSIPPPPPLTNSLSLVPPSPPALLPTISQSPKRAHTLPAFTQPMHAAEEPDKVMMVNDELLHKLTNGKANLNKPLFIPRSSDTSVPLDYHSPSEEVAEWLRGKGFSEPTVTCLGVLTGAQLFSLNKDELRAVIPDEGARVYSQLTVQKALLEDARRATELETVMEKQKMKVDLKLESSTL
ncbi:epidermal growth factor receptor kinase substrate 8-like protein 1 isoform X2 [Gouania willdenowi]|nr:epidermal growth factor receptor kinase substrate 8-like protein 1 isoform X2 [Gouania willdenowi]